MRFIAFSFAAVTMAWVSTAAPSATVQAPANPVGGNGQIEVTPETRKQLTDPKPLVRLHAALALAQRDDEQAIGVLIDLLAELPHDDRLQAEQALQKLAGEWSPNPALKGDDEISRKIRREAWAGWWRTMNGPALLAVFQAKGKLPLAAPRLLAIRKPKGATESLLSYLPSTPDHTMRDEIVKSLKSLVRAADKPAKALLDALTDPMAICRIAAAEALAGASGAQYWPALRKLLADADLDVRLRAAVALVTAHDKDAVPTLIKLLAELPRGKAWEAEELLHRLAGDKAPNVSWTTDDAAARNKLHDAWQAWWKIHGSTVNMAELEKTQGGLGLTVVAEARPRVGGKKGGAVLPPPGNPAAVSDRVVAIDRNGQPRWQIDNLDYPIDFHLLPGERVLIAEYGASRVTERDFKGNILWEVNNLQGAPVNVQRLANGNTFIALYTYDLRPLGGLLMEVDRTGKTVSSFNIGGAGGALGAAGAGGGFGALNTDVMFAAYRTADGHTIMVMRDQTCIRLDATGKEVKRFSVPGVSGTVPNAVANIEVTPKGHILVVQNSNAVMEYDADGKLIWEGKAAASRATRLVNGNTLAASQNGSLVELDTVGRVVWQYNSPAGLQALRARRK